MDYKKGLVSVVIPTYKRSDLLIKSIEAVLNQTYQNIELFVVNDNTPGDEYSQELYRITSGIKDPRFHILEQQKHINGAAARNVGIRASRGEFIAFQDDDDYWELNKIERQVELLSSLDESWGAVSCLKKLYKNGKLFEATKPYKSGFILQQVLDGRVSLGTGAVLIRRKALDDSGYFDEKLIRHQDLQLFARLASKYKIKLDCKYYQNRETFDTQNRIDSQKLLHVKKQYLSSIKDILEALPKRKKRIVLRMHTFDIAYALFKEHKYKQSFFKALVILKSPGTFYVAMSRLYTRFVETRCLNQLIKKYGNLE